MAHSESSHPQTAVGGHESIYKAPVQCYNCGSPDHLFNACPEPTRSTPFGYMAAKAAASSQAQNQTQGNGYGVQQSQNNWNGSGNAQKYQGPVVTKFPNPRAVVTRFVPPPKHPPQQFHHAYPPPNPAPYNQPPPPPPPQNYGQYNQQHGNPHWQPPPPPSYNQYGPPEYPAPQPQYNQQAPQYQAQYPPHHAPAPNNQYFQQSGYNEHQVSYQQAPTGNHQSSNGYQQPNFAAYPNQPPVNYHQQQGAPPHQQTQWVQPPSEYYGQQQNGQNFNAPAQPYYPPPQQPPQPQQQYPYNASHTHQPAPTQYHNSQMAPPAQQYQQYPQPQYEPSSQQYFQGNNQNAVPPPPPNSDPNFARSQRSASTMSYTHGNAPQSTSPPLSDEEEIEWMLERHLTSRLSKSGKSKPIDKLSTDEYYALLCEDEGICDPIGRPLPDIFNEDLILPPVYGATGVVSRFITPSNMAEFTRSIRDQSPPTKFGSDPFFLEADKETWRTEFRRWVDEHCGVAPDHNVVQRAPKSLKRATSSREEDHTDPEGSEEKKQESSIVAVKNNKRARISNSSRSPSNPADNSSMPTNTSSVERSATPSFDRGSTPSFDYSGEVPTVRDDDPWLIEPGEGSSQVEFKGSAVEVLAIPAPYGKNPSRTPHGSQHSHNTRSAKLSDQNPNSSYNQAQAPKRQDSGYVSARSSYSSSSNGNNASNTENPHGGRNGHHQTNSGQRSRQSHDQGGQITESPISSDSDHLRHGNSPLTPVSMELLGQTTRPLKGVLKDDCTRVHVLPRIKRRQPEVEAAYSRRW